MDKLDDFTRAYIEAAFFTSTDDNDNPFDESYGISDIAPDSLAKIIDDCNKFRAISEVSADLIRAGEIDVNYDDIRSGHDFWLTRTGHGSGFWSRELGACGDRLSNQARGFGNSDMYVGDDKQLHVSPIS
jgi:hypothetical protein